MAENLHQMPVVFQALRCYCIKNSNSVIMSDDPQRICNLCMKMLVRAVALFYFLLTSMLQSTHSRYYRYVRVHAILITGHPYRQVGSIHSVNAVKIVFRNFASYPATCVLYTPWHTYSSEIACHAKQNSHCTMCENGRRQ